MFVCNSNLSSNFHKLLQMLGSSTTKYYVTLQNCMMPQGDTFDILLIEKLIYGLH